jgi:thioredoxin 1
MMNRIQVRAKEAVMTKKMANTLILVAVAVAVGATLWLKERPTEEGPAASSVPAVPLPTLVDLGADKCIPCKKMAPILAELKEEYAGRFEVIFHDVWKNPELAKEYGVRVIPVQVFLDAEGKELFRHEGFYGREDILGKWRELGFSFEGEETKES